MLAERGIETRRYQTSLRTFVVVKGYTGLMIRIRIMTVLINKSGERSPESMYPCIENAFQTEMSNTLT